jgi:hypothetical protein
MKQEEADDSPPTVVSLNQQASAYCECTEVEVVI